jgi:hypothetical protein
MKAPPKEVLLRPPLVVRLRSPLVAVCLQTSQYPKVLLLWQVLLPPL